MTFQEIKTLVSNSANLTISDTTFFSMFYEAFDTFCSDTNLYNNVKIVDIEDSTVNYGGKIHKIYSIKDTAGEIYNYTIVREGNNEIKINIQGQDMEPVTTGEFFISYSYIPTLIYSLGQNENDIVGTFIFPDEYLKGIISLLLAQAFLRKSEEYIKSEDIELHNIFSEKAVYYNNIYNEVRKKCIKNTTNIIPTLPDVKQHDLGDF